MPAPQERLSIREASDLIRIGEPLPFRVLDAQERLLLNEGQVIGSDRQMEQLLERGAWVVRKLVEEHRKRIAPVTPGPILGSHRVATLFDRWEHELWALDALLRATAKGSASAQDWTAMVRDLVSLVERDVDIALFMAVRQDDRRFALYPLAHALHAAMLGLLAARQAGWSADRQHCVVGAALSMNVATLELQAQMAEQDTPPSHRQLELIRAHPMQAVQMLGRIGVADPLWLRAVAEHHEHADGRGYPSGVTDVCEEAHLLRMADVYMAKITARARRQPLPPQVASRQLFQSEPGAPLAMALIKAIGVHPPGALVMLKSGEVAVVRRRGAGSAPTVCTLSDRKGQPSVGSQMRDSADPTHAITGPCTDTAPFARVVPERVYGLVAP